MNGGALTASGDDQKWSALALQCSTAELVPSDWSGQAARRLIQNTVGAHNPSQVEKRASDGSGRKRRSWW